MLFINVYSYYLQLMSIGPVHVSHWCGLSYEFIPLRVPVSAPASGYPPAVTNTLTVAEYQ